VASVDLTSAAIRGERRAAARRFPAFALPLRLLTDWLPAAPLLALGACLLVAPAAALVLASLRADSGAWTLAAWSETLGRSADRRAIVTSLSLGAAAATVALAVGGPLAWLLSRATARGRTAWLALLNVGANFGGVGLAFAFTAVLGAYGMATLALRSLGLPFTPPGSASFVGLLLAYSYTNVPLFVLMTLPAMGALHRDWQEAAYTCGASPAQFWRFIGLPVLSPFLAAGWMLVFTWSVGLYSVAFALAGSAPNSPIRLMTLQIGLALTASTTHQERAAVHGTLLLLIAGATLLVYRLLMRRARRWDP
jgi:putative spermidine/putrescine transport system permease protein